MNDKHDYSLLRPVKFDELSLDDKLMIKDSSLTAVCSVVYKGSNFVVVKYKDGSDTVCTRHALSRDFTLAPLCWVEGKPVYPGDGPLYYKTVPPGSTTKKAFLHHRFVMTNCSFMAGRHSPSTPQPGPSPRAYRLSKSKVRTSTPVMSCITTDHSAFVGVLL